MDLRTNNILWETNVGKGVCGLEFDRKDIEMNKLVATCLGAKFSVFDMRTQHPKQGFANLTQTARKTNKIKNIWCFLIKFFFFFFSNNKQGHDSTIWTAKHLPHNRDVWVTTGGDGSVSLWKYSYPKERRRKDAQTEDYVGVVGEVKQLCIESVSTQPIVSWDWHKEKEGLGVLTALDQTVKIVVVPKTKQL
jgi:hypothetical protein